jgi:phosphatidylinositol alpha-1,6-mannosyltransferase
VNFLIVGTDFPPKTGGISTYTKELAMALSKRGQISVLAPGTNNSKAFDYACTFRIIRTPALPILCNIMLFIYLPLVIIRYRIDVVLHTIWLTALISHLYYRFLPIPYFISVHASEILDDTRTWRRRLKSYLKPWRVLALKRAKGLFPVSRYSAKIVASHGIEKNRICVISNGVDPQRFRSTDSYQRKTKINKLLTVARLDLHKGHDLVLEAIATLKREGFTPEYRIVGIGEEEAHLRKKVQTLGLNQQVKFMGFISDSKLPGIYAESDIFVMASRQIPGRLDLIEGFGIAFLEASASGLPVIAGNSGGVSDAVRDGETGLLVNPDKPDDIARAIKRLLIDSDLARQYGKKGREWVETQKSWDCIAEQMQGAIQRLTDLE